MTSDAWISDLLESAKEFRAKHPLPHAWYNPEGDAIEVYLEEGPAVYESVDKFLTVLVQRENRTQVVGFVLKRIKSQFKDVIKEITAIRHDSFLSLLLYEAGSKSIKTVMRSPDAPPGVAAPRMNAADLIHNMKATPHVKVDNPEELQEAIA